AHVALAHVDQRAFERDVVAVDGREALARRVRARSREFDFGGLGARVVRQARRGERGGEREGGERQPAHQKPPSPPMLGRVTGPFSVPPMDSLWKVALSISATNEIQPVFLMFQRFSRRKSSR